MTKALRDKMGKAALIDYEGVGTVEFLVDNKTFISWR